LDRVGGGGDAKAADGAVEVSRLADDGRFVFVGGAGGGAEGQEKDDDREGARVPSTEYRAPSTEQGPDALGQRPAPRHQSRTFPEGTFRERCRWARPSCMTRSIAWRRWASASSRDIGTNSSRSGITGRLPSPGCGWPSALIGCEPSSCVACAGLPLPWAGFEPSSPPGCCAG